MASKEREKQILNEFLGRLNKDCSILEDDREKPDFALKLDGETIGMELTEFFLGEKGKNGSILRHRERQLASLESLLRAEDTRGIDAFVSLEFTNDLLPRVDELRDLVLEITAFVSSVDLAANSGDWVWTYNYQLSSSPLMSKHLKVISCHPLGAGSGLHWWFPSPQDIEVTDDFRDRLRDKIDNLPAYRSNLPGHPMHLLIHAEDDSDSSMSPDEEELHTALHDWAAQSGFDGVWFIARQSKKLYSIWPVK